MGTSDSGSGGWSSDRTRNLIRLFAVVVGVGFLVNGLWGLVRGGEDSIDLGVGDCFDGDPAGAVTLLACAEPHAGEVVHVEPVGAEGRPTEPELRVVCADEVESYVGGPLPDTLAVGAVVRQDEAGEDARALCVVVDAAGEPLTGSVRGQGQ